MKMMTIFRVVDSDNIGLYGSKTLEVSLWDRACQGQHCPDKHPTPFKDGIKEFPFHWQFGFKDSEQINSWIHKQEWKENINALGGKVLMILIPKDWVYQGKTQVVYDPTEAVEILEMSILEI